MDYCYQLTSKLIINAQMGPFQFREALMKYKFAKFGLIAIGWLLASMGQATAQTVIDMTSGADIAGFRTGGVYDEGQTFIAPVGDTVLKSFDYFIQGRGGEFLYADLYTWSDAAGSTIGNSLWSSGPTFFSGTGSYDWVKSISKLSFVPNVLLTANQSYALTFHQYSSSANYLLAGETYAGGTAIVNTGNGWSTWGGIDAPLILQFTTAVPEPETYAMMLAGLGLMCSIARRRKAKQTA